MKKGFQYKVQLYISRRPALNFATDLVQVYLDRRIGRSAAELAYYLTLTIFPMLAIALWIVGKLPITEYQLTSFLTQVFPPTTMSAVNEYVRYAKSSELLQGNTFLTAGGLTIFLAASAAFRSLVTTSSEIYNRKVYPGVWFFLTSILFPVLLVLMVYASMLTVLTGRWFVRFLRQRFPILPIFGYWPTLRLLMMYAVAMLVLLLLYWLTAPKGKYRPPAVLGACLTALVLTAASAGFSLIVTFSSRYSVVYGSLASMIILMVWLYLCSNIVILGNVFNYVLWQYKKDEDIEYVNRKE